ncbi:hypothetical protein PoB_002444200 [Plakobranchus ocellatus]|uniref:Uncharacterized protein n=1 Tax=Plakobranchus ocellatus TaxID=259542 RepID=A0AAV3ZS27_9GAST|nr:hypothetical protein PoB_002444200 [Plakobranchus ocellatus]
MQELWLQQCPYQNTGLLHNASDYAKSQSEGKCKSCGCSNVHIKTQVSCTMHRTVRNPNRKENARLLNEFPVAKYLKQNKRNAIWGICCYLSHIAFYNVLSTV